MNLVVFAGNKLANDFIAFSLNANCNVTAITATNEGALCLEHSGTFLENHGKLHVIVGRKDSKEIAILLQELNEKETIDCVIDATHTYATLAKNNIEFACDTVHLPLYKLSRGTQEVLYDTDCIVVSSAKEASSICNKIAGNIFCAVGTKDIEAFCDVVDYKKRVFLRILPSETSLQHALNLGYDFHNIIAMTGSFSFELNTAMFDSTNAKVLVTKDGGIIGGIKEKLLAAKAKDMQIIVIAPPKNDSTTKLYSLENLCKTLGIKTSRHCIMISCNTGLIPFLSLQAISAIKASPLVISSMRLHDNFLPLFSQKSKVFVVASDIVDCLEKEENIAKNMIAPPVILFSGDTGFFSGASNIRTKLLEKNWTVDCIAGTPIIATFAAILGKNWQKWHIVSVHENAKCAALEITRHEATFFLCGVMNSHDIIDDLLRHGVTNALISVGQNLGTKDEYIKQFLIDDYSNNLPISHLECVLVEQELPTLSQVTFGIDDSEFIRGSYATNKIIPMTKQYTRTAILTALNLHKGEHLWDVGGGTGSVSIEAVLSLKVSVTTFEKEKASCKIIAQNRKKFGAWGLTIVEGNAPEVFNNEFTKPDAVFIGGSSNNLIEIIQNICKIAPKCRLVISACSLETLSLLQNIASLIKCKMQVIQLQQNISKLEGERTLLLPASCVFIIKLLL